MTTHIAPPDIAVASRALVRRPVGVANRVASTLRVAAFSCTGLTLLSRSLGFDVAVVAAVADPARHVKRLADRWYASGTAMEESEWPCPFDFDNWDFRDWRHVAVEERRLGRRQPALGLRCDDGSLLVTLPGGISQRRFSLAFRKRLCELRFDVVARHPARCANRYRTGRPVTVRPRYAYASPTDPSPVEVTDLVIFRVPRIADMAAATLAGFSPSPSV